MEASSPTTLMEAVLRTLVINVMEQQEVATMDILWAFMQSNQDKTVHVKLDGTLADLLMQCNQDLYKP